MRKSFIEMMEYLFLPNTLYLGFRNVRSDYISHPIPHCRGIPRQDAMGTLIVKSRRFCRKSQWRPRYCVISDEDLFIYKDKTGRSEDVETRHVNLSHAVRIRVVSSYQVPKPLNKMQKKRPGKVDKRKKTPKPVCFIKIVDETKRKLELEIMDANDVVYWMAGFCAAFFGTEISPKMDWKSLVVRSTIEETRTHVVKSAMILERNVLEDVSPSQFRNRHWTASSTVEAHDELLSPSASADTSSPTPSPSSKKARLLRRKMAAVSPSRAVMSKVRSSASARARTSNVKKNSPIRAY